MSMTTGYTDEARCKMQYYSVGTQGTEILRETKYYLGDYEEKINASGEKSSLHYLSAGNGLFAIIEIKNNVTTPYYVLTDYQGNYHIITDSKGNKLETLSFDPWGRRRNPTNWSFTSVPKSYLFDRGYTGHEHLDRFGLINMNGRVYDPFLARFLSPDPFVQAPTFSQNFNRYSYAFNNPLKYTDPDGNNPLLIAALIGGTANWLFHGAQFNAKGLGYFAIGAGAGALGFGIGAGVASLTMGGSFVAGFTGSCITQTSFLAGAAGGFTGGFVNGTGNSILDNDNIGTALTKGTVSGVIGGFIGGVGAGFHASNEGRDFWNGGIGKNSTSAFYIGRASGDVEFVDNYNGSMAQDSDTELLKSKYLDKFGVEEGSLRIGKISSEVPKGYKLTTFGNYYRNGRLYGGFTSYNKYSGLTNINICQSAILGNDSYFRAIAGHELVHAYHYFILGADYWSPFSESIAYNYTNSVLGRYSSSVAASNSSPPFFQIPNSYQIPSPFNFFY